jgi:hypothetical protein
MPHATIITELGAVNAFLEKHGLTEGYSDIEAILLQAFPNSPDVAPAIMLVFKDRDTGKLTLGKTTFRLMKFSIEGMEAVLSAKGHA